jgi:hypothetical protein
MVRAAAATRLLIIEICPLVEKTQAVFASSLPQTA